MNGSAGSAIAEAWRTADREGVHELRRVVRALDETLTPSADHELVRDRNAVDLLWLRMGQLRECLTRLGEEFGGDLPTPDEVVAPRHLCPSVDDMLRVARASIDQAVRALTLAGADPADLSLDLPVHRLAEVVSALNDLRGELEASGVAHVYLFGSVSRGDDRYDSDVDVAFDVSEGSDGAFSLIDQARLQRRLEETLQLRVDLVELTTLRASVRQRVDKDIVRIW